MRKKMTQIGYTLICVFTLSMPPFDVSAQEVVYKAKTITSYDDEMEWSDTYKPKNGVEFYINTSQKKLIINFPSSKETTEYVITKTEIANGKTKYYSYSGSNFCELTVVDKNSDGIHKIFVLSNLSYFADKSFDCEQTNSLTKDDRDKSDILQEFFTEALQEVAAKQINEVAKNTTPAQTTAPKTQPKKELDIEMVYVMGGTFQMGSSDKSFDNYPVCDVTLSSFYIGKYEVTQSQWQTIMCNNPSGFIGDDMPVEQVNWTYCQEFIRKLNEKTGKQYRLPTEAEWEYAARGGNKSKGYLYSGSNKIDEVAFFLTNSNNSSHIVGQKKPNELGIYDMSGNVWEFCSDWSGGRYSKKPQKKPTGPKKSRFGDKIMRGGAWNCRKEICNVYDNYISDPNKKAYKNTGLRLVLPQ